MDTNSVLGIIPGGTGNDFVKSLGISMDPMRAMDQILVGNSLGVDVGTVEDSQNSYDFLNVAGMGFDVEVLKNTEKMKNIIKGPISYLFSVLLAMFGAKPLRISLTTSEGKIQRDILLVAIGNGQYYGGGMCVCPDASVKDGLFDVCIANSIPRWKIPLILPKFMKGKHLDVRLCRIFQVLQHRNRGRWLGYDKHGRGTG